MKDHSSPNVDRREESAPAVQSSRPDIPRADASRRLLLVTYTFPPVGGAGVQRVAKFAKYFPTCGWDVTVLTVANPSVPLHDDSLCQDIPPETEVCRSRTWEPSYGLKSAIVSKSPARSTGGGLMTGAKQLVKSAVRSAVNVVLQPDPQILWRPSGISAGNRLLQSQRFDAIVASGPPFSTFLLAASLSRRSGLPLVLDYRDEWDISNQYWENKRLGTLSLAIQQRMQRSVLRQAAVVVATTQASADSLQSHCLSAGSKARVGCIYNGFDPDDFSAVTESIEPSFGDQEPYRLTYVGTLWALTTIRPIAEAVQRVLGANPELNSRDRFRLVVAGRRTDAEQEVMDCLGQTSEVVETHSYVAHGDAVRLMKESDELLVLLADLPGVGRVLPAKAFEYLATGRPILAVAPRGELWSVLERFSHVQLFEPSQVSEIARYLAARVRGELPRARDVSKQVKASGFDRRTQTERLAEMIGEVVHV